jgi:hypothetical protein
MESAPFGFLRGFFAFEVEEAVLDLLVDFGFVAGGLLKPLAFHTCISLIDVVFPSSVYIIYIYTHTYIKVIY